jgi:hypothetical protein
MMLNGSLNHEIKRTGTTKLPTAPAAGVASYDGSYMAVYTNSDFVAPGFEATGHIIGDVTLDVDLANAKISGSVFNRENTGGTEMNDITLSETDLSGGAFFGAASGGGFKLSGYTGGAVNYGGLIVGPDGAEIVGIVRGRHFGGGPVNIFDEVGGIVAVK